MTKFCSIDGCDKPMRAKGMCTTHYMRAKRHGSPDVVLRRLGRSDQERFWQYVSKTETCWLWTGTLSHGYGSFYLGRPEGGYRQVMAHRFAYELLIGPIPDGLTLDHLKDRCGDKRCVKVVADVYSPAHLEPVTLRVNIQRGSPNKAKTHCKRGHEFTAENTRPASSKGGRACRACDEIHKANRRERERKG